MILSILKKIKTCFQDNLVLYTKHSKTEMENENFGKILDRDVFEAISSGEIIAEYSDDKPYSSYLIYGKTRKGRPIHTVCAYDEEDKMVIVITVYEPDPKLWVNFKERKIK